MPATRVGTTEAPEQELAALMGLGISVGVCIVKFLQGSLDGLESLLQLINSLATQRESLGDVEGHRFRSILPLCGLGGLMELKGVQMSDLRVISEPRLPQRKWWAAFGGSSG